MFSFGHRIPVRIYPLFFFMAIVIGWLNSFTWIGTCVWTGVIFVSVLIHEYGHAITSILFGQRPHIELIGFGGVTQRQGGRLSLWKEFLIVFNGPFAGLVLALLAYQLLRIVGPKESLASYILEVAVYVNLVWTLLNLLPIQPLDGGHLLAIVMEGMFGFRGLKAALLISVILAAAVSVFMFMAQALIAGTLFLMLAFESFRSWKYSLAIKDHDRDLVLQAALHLACEKKDEGNDQEAIDQLMNIRNKVREGIIYIQATEMLAEILNKHREFDQAYRLLLPLEKKLSSDSLKLLLNLSFALKHWQQARLLGEKTYRLFPSVDVSLLNARIAAARNEVKPALGWLQCAVRDGAQNLPEFTQHSEFDNIRKEASFQNWIKNHST